MGVERSKTIPAFDPPNALPDPGDRAFKLGAGQ